MPVVFAGPAARNGMRQFHQVVQSACVTSFKSARVNFAHGIPTAYAAKSNMKCFP